MGTLAIRRDSTNTDYSADGAALLLKNAAPVTSGQTLKIAFAALSPTSHTEGIVAADIGVQFQHAFNGRAADIVFSTANPVLEVFPIERLRINYLGNVGIGTAAPGAPLHISSSAYPQAIIQAAAGETSAALNFSASGATARTYRLLSSNDGAFHVWDVSGSSPRLSVASGGNVGIGTASPQHLLSVNGAIAAKDVIVTASGWADHVFRPGYRLAPLSEVENHIQRKGHLPGIPSEAEVKEKGVNVAEMQAKHLAKIEELTLHVITLEKQVAQLRGKPHKNAVRRHP